MLLRNWIEFGVILFLFLTGMLIRYRVRSKVKKVDGFKGINQDGPGRGWKMR